MGINYIEYSSMTINPSSTGPLYIQDPNRVINVPTDALTPSVVTVFCKIFI